jgi:hypothetical protein
MMMEEEAGEEPVSAFDEYGAEALGLDPGDPAAGDRLAALKAAIMACMDTDYGGEEKAGKSKGGGDALALIFGGKK